MNITQLISLGDSCVNHIALLKKHLWVTTESELSKKIQSLKVSDFPLLVTVTPSFDSKGRDNDDVQNIAQMLFFVLTKGGFQSEKSNTIQLDMDTTFLIASQIQQLLLSGIPGDDLCVMPNKIIQNSFHIDPEFNYLGTNGWSISFQTIV